MSYTYAPQANQEPEKKKVEKPPLTEKTASGVSMDSLRDMYLRPSAEDKGHRAAFPDEVREQMENAFHMRMEAVKLYESQRVADAGADAVARGNEIAFAPGKLDFSSRRGRSLLGHELSHVSSQARGEVTGSGFLDNPALEQRADREGAIAASGGQVYSGGMYGGGWNGVGMYAPLGPISSASAAPAAAPMQASKPKKSKKKQGKKAPEPRPIQDDTPASPEWAALQTAGQEHNTKEIISSYNDIAKQQSENVTEEQFDAVNNYIADSRPINGYLRGNMKMDKSMQQTQMKNINLIDQAMSNNRLGANVTGYRGVADVALASILKQSGDKELRKCVRKDGSIDHEKFAKVKDRMVGTEFTDKGYGSTSVNEEYAERWRKGIRRREADSILMEETFKKVKNRPKYKEHFQNKLAEKGVKKFSDMNNTDQLNLKKDAREFLTEEEFLAREDREDELVDNMGAHMYEINAPKGSKATMIDQMRKNGEGQKGNAGQQEMLIGRNARYKITGIQQMMDENHVPMENQYRIIMDLLNDEDE